MNIEIALRMALVYFIVDHWSQSDCNVLPVKVRLQRLRAGSEGGDFVVH